jgi:uncharacterized membrane protein (UPF0182 family)
MSKRPAELSFRVLIIAIGTWITVDLIAHGFGEILWFEEVGYLSTLITRWQTQFCLWVIICSLSSLFLLGNIGIASGLAWRWLPPNEEGKNGTPYLPQSKEKLSKITRLKYFALRGRNFSQLPEKTLPYTCSRLKNTPPSVPIVSYPTIRLPLLLPIVLILSFIVSLLLLYYSQIAFSTWQPNYNLAQVTPTLPLPIALNSLPGLIQSLINYAWQIGVVVIIIIFILLKPTFALRAIAVYFSWIFALVITGNWGVVLQFFNPTSFAYKDPQFHKDISFYVFNLPFRELLDFWLSGLVGYSLVACLLFYLLSGNSLSEGKFPGFSVLQIRHLFFLATALMVALTFRHWFNRYDLVYSPRGVTYGASYTDVYVQLPLETSLCIIALTLAIWFFIKGLTYSLDRQKQKANKNKFPLSILVLATYIFLLLFGSLFSKTVQIFVVQPNELTKEKPYIERSIAMTRKAFGLKEIDAKTFDPQGQLTATDIKENHLTIENIRLWDTRPILQTNRQLQQIRLYYKFPDADIDRYILERKESETESSPQTNKQQVIIAARELDYSAVPKRAKTWLNKHLVYTHGYGFTMSPVNQVDEGGLPYYFVKDIGTETAEEGSLHISNQLIRESIPIGKPRIYYGELTDTYVMTSTKVKELDFPSGEDNVYNTYDGTGGIKIGNYGRRLLFAEYLKDWQMLFTQNFTPETKLLFRRDIQNRVRAIAPFLNYDRDPYLIVADRSDQKDKTQKSYLYWILDAYTTSDRYPYSDPGSHQFNYIRNSVKVVIDAYNGDVNFYVADPQDPLIQTWNKIFPRLFKPLEAIPASLLRHLRYPEDMFSTQSERLLTYHMTDPQVFYNREDQWEIPEEIYGTESQSVEPYYLIIKLPTATEEEFILLHPYTPTSRPNLIGWLAARSDGENYGKLLLYKFPKQKLVYGPNQIEALINQDPIISQQISLWNREGSRAIQGNLLIIPIEDSLLYVEPLYIEAERNSVPTLARVIVVYENQIVMAATLEEALDAIFAPDQNSTPTINRPVDDLLPVIEEESEAQ